MKTIDRITVASQVPFGLVSRIVQVMDRTGWSFKRTFEGIRCDWYCGDTIDGLHNVGEYIADGTDDPKFPAKRSAVKAAVKEYMTHGWTA